MYTIGRIRSQTRRSWQIEQYDVGYFYQDSKEDILQQNSSTPFLVPEVAAKQH